MHISIEKCYRRLNFSSLPSSCSPGWPSLLYNSFYGLEIQDGCHERIEMGIYKLNYTDCMSNRWIVLLQYSFWCSRWSPLQYYRTLSLGIYTVRQKLSTTWLVSIISSNNRMNLFQIGLLFSLPVRTCLPVKQVIDRFLFMCIWQGV